MTRKTFLTLVSFVALAVGAFALGFPAALLASKGVAPSAAAGVWVREVGVLLIAVGAMCFAVRGHAASPTLRAFLLGNALLHAGLFPIELIAYAHGVITRAAGVAPNSVLHVVLAAAFAWYAATIDRTRRA